MKRFDKHAITTTTSYKQEFERICDLEFCNYQQIKRKYQANEEFYDKDKLIVDVENEPHELRSSVRFYKGKIRLEMMPIKVELVRPNSHVLRKILSIQNNYKNPQNNNPSLE